MALMLQVDLPTAPEISEDCPRVAYGQAHYARQSALRQPCRAFIVTIRMRSPGCGESAGHAHVTDRASATGVVKEPQVDSMGIEGAWTFTPRIYSDDRGQFHEWFHAAELFRDLGYQFNPAQANCSVSHRGVIRGIHFAEIPPGQAKYIVCASGAVMDVVVDLRSESPTYGCWEAVQLDDVARRAVFISEGLGHGFMALSAQATVMYLCSTAYAPAIEHGVHPLDPALGIAWPSDAEPILSQKDAAAPGLDVARRAGLLPAYSDCRAFAAGLRSGYLPAES